MVAISSSYRLLQIKYIYIYTYRRRKMEEEFKCRGHCVITMEALGGVSEAVQAEAPAAQPPHELMAGSDPPFHTTYKSLIDAQEINGNNLAASIEECELPVIDLSRLDSYSDAEREQCKTQIASASLEWGFFQLVNHGVSQELLERLHREQLAVFRQPFEKKATESLLDFSADSYRWGTSSATCLRELSWSEAYHIPLAPSSEPTGTSTLRCAVDELAREMSRLSHMLARILAEELGYKGTYFKKNCTYETCYLRLNRYPPCSIHQGVYGLIPHTDSDFLTIVYQDEVGGLQLMKNNRWIAIKPNFNALIINIGDLFEAWSNGKYRSVEHRVVSNPRVERFSVAFFFCPSYDTIIDSNCKQPAIYRKFSFREYRRQVQEDVKLRGHKVGLPRFLA